MIEWDTAFRRDLDSTNWIEGDIRRDYSALLDPQADLAVGCGYLFLLQKFLDYAREHNVPLIVKSASEKRARLVIDYVITRPVEPKIARAMPIIAEEITRRSRKVCERCGDPGQPQIIRGGINAHKVLCHNCQRMYDDAIFFDQAIPTIVTVIREYVSGYRGTFADLDRDIVDAFALPQLPKTGRRRTRAMLKRVWVEICLAVLRPDMKRWWHDA